MCHAIYPDGGHFVTRGTENLIQYHPLPKAKAKKESKYRSFYSPWFGFALDRRSIKHDHLVTGKICGNLNIFAKDAGNNGDTLVQSGIMILN